jgi:hypothetical protein
LHQGKKDGNFTRNQSIDRSINRFHKAPFSVIDFERNHLFVLLFAVVAKRSGKLTLGKERIFLTRKLSHETPHIFPLSPWPCRFILCCFMTHRRFFLVALFGLLGVSHGAPWTPQNAAWNVNFNRDTNPATFHGQAPCRNYTYHPSPVDWRAESVYQVITDRFADGRPENNDGNHYGFGGYDLKRIDYRHGGDLAGTLHF